MEIMFEKTTWSENLSIIGITGDIKAHLFDPPTSTVISNMQYRFAPIQNSTLEKKAANPKPVLSQKKI